MNLREEKKLFKKGFKRVAGLDEAGRGSLAGPVVAAAVMLNSKFKIQISKLKIKNLKDSKKLSPQKREQSYKILTLSPYIEWGIGKASEKIIDKINIKNASELAMERALKNLEGKIKKRVDFLIIDGNHINSKRLKERPHKLIVKADEKVFSCMAASIIAKVTRDRIMQYFHRKYPCYQFDKHKGYPTILHQQILKKYPPSVIHRKTFRPIKK